MVGALLVLLIMTVATGSVIWTSIQNGISPMPSSPKVQHRFIASLPMQINGDILELGCGWGSLAFPLAQRYPHTKVVAFENSWIPYLFCRLRHHWQPLPNLTFRRQNFFNASFQNTGLIVCYLYPGAMQKLKAKFAKELPSEAIIATHTFAIIGWTPVYTEVINDLYHTTIYHYVNHQTLPD